MRDGSDDTRIVPSGSRISARPAPESATRAVDLRREHLRGERVGEAVADDGVEAMFSATAIIRCPRTSRNSLRRLGHRDRRDRDQHDDDHQQLEHQELAGQARVTRPCT